MTYMNMIDTRFKLKTKNMKETAAVLVFLISCYYT